MAMQRSVSFAGFMLVLCGATACFGQGFNPTNLVVSHNNIAYEYTRSGVQVRSIPVPHPDTAQYDVYDVLVDGSGRLQARNTAPFSNNYLSTYNPMSGSWTHTLHLAGGVGNISDGDLSRWGQYLWTNSRRFDLTDLSSVPISPGGFRGVSEVSIGQDGLMYVVNSGSPREELRVLDPFSLALLRTLELRDAASLRLDARGIAVTPQGTIFAVDWNGAIYRFDPTGLLTGQVATGVGNPLCLDMDHAGNLVVGGRFGQVALTTTALGGVSLFTVGNSETYVSFVPSPGATGLLVWCCLCAARRRRCGPA
jgi:hypothetical protein